MRGCCCFSSKGTELKREPAYYYYPRASEHVPLSSQQGGNASAFSAGLLVDTNLDTSIPETYRPPPAPMPYDVVLGRPCTPPVAQQISGYKTAGVQTINSDSVQETTGDYARETSPKCKGIQKSDCKEKIEFGIDTEKDSKIELSKSVESIVLALEDEDCCPTCLEEYDAENPKITTKCEHHFHLACILEWMERSDTCPVCTQEMKFNLPID